MGKIIQRLDTHTQLIKWSVTRLRRRFETHDDGSLADLVAFGDVDRFDSDVGGRGERVFHLHGFENCQRRAAR